MKGLRNIIIVQQSLKYWSIYRNSNRVIVWRSSATYRFFFSIINQCRIQLSLQQKKMHGTENLLDKTLLIQNVCVHHNNIMVLFASLFYYCFPLLANVVLSVVSDCRWRIRIDFQVMVFQVNGNMSCVSYPFLIVWGKVCFCTTTYNNEENMANMWQKRLNFLGFMPTKTVLVFQYYYLYK